MTLVEYIYACNIAYYMMAQQQPTSKEAFILSWSRSRIEDLDGESKEFVIKLCALQGKYDDRNRSLVVEAFNYAAVNEADLGSDLGPEYRRVHQGTLHSRLSA